MYPKLKIYDFDRTITFKHTAQNPSDFKPETNTKEGLKGLFEHNKKSLSAIATFHSQPEYILSYLLPLLDLTEEDIVEKAVLPVKSGEHHQLFQVFFKDCPYPLTIATPIAENYNTHLRALVRNGKNDLLKAIKENLPPCYEYHYFEDEKSLYENALFMREFHRHRTNPESMTFMPFLAEAAVSPLQSLKTMVIAHLAELSSVKEEEVKTSAHVNLSIFSDSLNDNASASTLPIPQTMAALTELLQFLDYEIDAPKSNTVDALAVSSFKDVIAYWEMTTGEQFAPFIAKTVQEREEAAKVQVTYEEEEDDETTGYGF